MQVDRASSSLLPMDPGGHGLSQPCRDPYSDKHRTGGSEFDDSFVEPSKREKPGELYQRISTERTGFACVAWKVKSRMRLNQTYWVCRGVKEACKITTQRPLTGVGELAPARRRIGSAPERV
jgi:hypothetical protein